MLQIRPEQIAAFEAVERRKVRERLHAELRAQLPKHCESLGESGTAALIEEACVRAGDHRLDTPGGYAMFVRLTLLFGRGFEQEADWARAVLADPSIADADTRAVRLGQAAVAYARAAAESHGEGR